MFDKEKSVISYYLLCNKLKDLIRSGWKEWDLKRERLESVAEHVFGVQSLAIAIYSQYEYDLDLYKVILMLSIHELEETLIGDITPFNSNYKNKEKLGHEAISKILKPLVKGEMINKLILEFDKRESKEAIFAYHCDKLECDIQCKLYDQENCFKYNDLSKVDKDLRKLLEGKDESWSTMWLKNDRNKYRDDQNFLNLLDYVLYNKIN